MSKPSSQPRCNDKIRSSRVKVIDHHGEQRGDMSLRDALNIAEEAGLDLVEVAPEAKPPVVKIMDYGRVRYQQEKKLKADRRSRTRDPHQIRLSPVIAEHDLDTKRRAAQKFLEKGDQVRISVLMRGRQRAHPQLAIDLLSRLIEELAVFGVPLRPAQHDNHASQVTLAPPATAAAR